MITIILSMTYSWIQTTIFYISCLNITENIRKALDNGSIGCGVFVDLQKAFDTVDHQRN